MLGDLFTSVRLARQLYKRSANLHHMRESSSTDEYTKLLAAFEVEVDGLNKILIDQFGEDPNVMQMTFELKSAVVALKADNVETAKSLS
jgi:hypothetical protein